ncbi:hypothetical protein Tco_0311713 [Tanacetum coccineum]
MSGEEPATQIATVESPQMVFIVKLPILKKGAYTLWSMRMEQYLTNTDYSLWQVILNGDGPIQYQLRFNAIKDAKTLWAVIKSRFGGNVESKKMQKNGAYRCILAGCYNYGIRAARLSPVVELGFDLWEIWERMDAFLVNMVPNIFSSDEWNNEKGIADKNNKLSVRGQLLIYLTLRRSPRTLSSMFFVSSSWTTVRSHPEYLCFVKASSRFMIDEGTLDALPYGDMG